MTIDLRTQQRLQRDQLRYAATAKRLRASREGALVCDTTDALVVWLPRHVVPQYAVPRDALGDGLPEGAAVLEGDGVDGHVLLPFGEFDWLEEDEPVIGHPHDPFARIDVLHSTREVRVELDGVELARSRRPVALFETGLPTRWYLPTHDVRTELLAPSDTRTTCAYKGHASYLSAEGENGRDIAWCYRNPLREAEPVRDLLCFWAERTVTTVDGVREHGYTGPRPDDA
ncbi:DUF427 domain-containing protein [Terrabacter sp. 2RAF25]|uniref:DUF427 domain-containing protein n=1 Tax=Terrabacter sp. 2RAF25 TaxID=3232998 RepID=UPI003F9CD996